jgi:hypothetical protein
MYSATLCLYTLIAMPRSETQSFNQLQCNRTPTKVIGSSYNINLLKLRSRSGGHDGHADGLHAAAAGAQGLRGGSLICFELPAAAS